MSLYELTRKLVARGCPEHPRLLWVAGLWLDHHPLKSDRRAAEVHDDDARAIWTLWALEWLRDMTDEHDIHVEHHESTGWQVSSCFESEWKGPNGTMGKFKFHQDHHGPTILEAIEAATRHLEPTEHEEDFKHAEPGCD